MKLQSNTIELIIKKDSSKIPVEFPKNFSGILYIPEYWNGKYLGVKITPINLKEISLSNNEFIVGITPAAILAGIKIVEEGLIPFVITGLKGPFINTHKEQNIRLEGTCHKIYGSRLIVDPKNIKKMFIGGGEDIVFWQRAVDDDAFCIFDNGRWYYYCQIYGNEKKGDTPRIYFFT